MTKFILDFESINIFNIFTTRKILALEQKKHSVIHVASAGFNGFMAILLFGSP